MARTKQTKQAKQVEPSTRQTRQTKPGKRATRSTPGKLMLGLDALPKVHKKKKVEEPVEEAAEGVEESAQQGVEESVQQGVEESAQQGVEESAEQSAEQPERVRRRSIAGGSSSRAVPLGEIVESVPKVWVPLNFVKPETKYAIDAIVTDMRSSQTGVEHFERHLNIALKAHKWENLSQQVPMEKERRIITAAWDVAVAYNQHGCYPGPNGIRGPIALPQVPSAITDGAYNEWWAENLAVGAELGTLEEKGNRLGHEFATNLLTTHGQRMKMMTIQFFGMKAGAFDGHIECDTIEGGWYAIDFFFNVMFVLKCRTPKDLYAFLYNNQKDRGYLLDEYEVQTLIREGVHEHPGNVDDIIEVAREIWDWTALGAQMKKDFRDRST